MHWHVVRLGRVDEISREYARELFERVHPQLESRPQPVKDYPIATSSLCYIIRKAAFKAGRSSKPVPIIDPLSSLLVELRAAEGNPRTGPILRGQCGEPLNLDNLAKRTVRPILAAAGLEWRGWYALRRGIATLVSSVEKDAMAAKGLLRHASVTTTQKHFIKEIPEITLRAMEKVGMLFNKCSTVGTAKPIKMRRVRKSGSAQEFVKVCNWRGFQNPRGTGV
jgi:hypothetical protein